MLDREDVESLRQEIADGCAALADVLAAIRASAGEDASEAREVYAGGLRNVAMGAGLIGSTALAEATTVLERNLGELPLHDGERHRSVCDRLAQWPPLFLSYLEAPNADTAGAIIAYLKHPVWPAPVDADEGEALRLLFTQELPAGAGTLPGTADEPADVPADSEDADLREDGVSAETADTGEVDLDAGPAMESIEADADEDQTPVCEPPEEGEDPQALMGAPVMAVDVPEPVLEDADALDSEECAAAVPAAYGEPIQPAGNPEVSDNVVDSDEASASREAMHDAFRAPVADTGSDALLGVLAGEVADVRGELEDALEAFTAAEDGSPALAEAVERYGGVVDRLCVTCEMLGLGGLHEVCAFVSTNLLELAAEARSARAAMRERLHGWPGLVLDYLREPSNDSACKALLRHLQEGGWPSPLGDDAAHELLRRLVEAQTVFPVETGEAARPTEARPEDVSLQVPEDVNPELLDAFLQEAPAHGSEFSACMQRLHERTASREDVKLAQRIVHTLKGSAHLIGIRGIAVLAHHVEDILEFIGSHAVSPPPPLMQTLVGAADCLEEMIEAVGERAPTPTSAEGVLQRVLDWAHRADKGAFRDDDIAASAAATLSSRVPDAGLADDAELPREAPGLAGAEAQQVLRVPTRSIDELLRLVAELSVSINQIQDRYERATEHLRALREHDALVQDRSFELEDLVDTRGVGVMQSRLRRTGTHNETFDPLELNQYNELHSITQGVIEAASDARQLGAAIQDDLAALEELFVRQERLNKVLQQAVMATRMVPVRNIVPRLERTVRQTCRATRKHAQLEITGRDILMDGEVLQKLFDPLMHILRNAIDHGIEFSGERARLGKPEVGRVGLHFSRIGNAILVRCEDDGRGLDFEKIRRAALERGLITPGAELKERELTRLLFTPGFSTQSTATHTSGRGIGLDVVYSTVIGMKGSVEIESGAGGGCCISMRLPVSLISAHVLLVQLLGQRYGIPTTNLEQILAGGGGLVEVLDGTPMLRLADETYPVHRLAELLHVADEETTDEDLRTKPMLLVRADAGVVAIAVDRVLGGRDLVIKGMGRYVKGVTGVLGAAVLGDGTAMSVLDIAEMLRTPLAALPLADVETQAAGLTRGAARVLIVDDSLSARRSLSELVKDAGYEPMLAKDGLDAVDILGQSRPDIVLVDLEMPRMNGLEFTIHLRGREDTANLPVIIVTSRSTDKHRRQALLAGANAYVTKPFQQSELLDLIEAMLAQASAAHSADRSQPVSSASSSLSDAISASGRHA